MSPPPQSSPDPLRIVQVGAGAMGRAWLHTVGASTDARIVGLVDLDVTAARAAAAECGHAGVPVAATLSELLDGVEADAVLDVVVPEAHLPVSLTALEAGLPVLCEKPLAGSVAAGLAMVAAAEAAGRLVMVSQSRRYFRTLRSLQRQLGRLGAIGTVTCTFAKAPRLGGFREEMDFPLLLDMAIHPFDLARLLVPSPPVAVYCDSSNPPWSWFRGDAEAVATFEFAGGQRFAYAGSWCAPGLETSWNGHWRIGTETGTAVWDGDRPPHAEWADGTPVVVPADDGPEEIAGSLVDFVDAVRTGRTPATEVHDNVLSLAMVEAAITSATRRQRVTIAEVLDAAYATALATTHPDAVADTLRGWSSVHAVVADA